MSKGHSIRTQKHRLPKKKGKTHSEYDLSLQCCSEVAARVKHEHEMAQLGSQAVRDSNRPQLDRYHSLLLPGCAQARVMAVS